MRNRYTVSRLYEELSRFKIGRLFLRHLGAIEIPREMLLSVPRQGIGLLYANPGGKRRRDGTRGRVFIPWLGSGRRRQSRGTTKARKMYRGRAPVQTDSSHHRCCSLGSAAVAT